MKKEKNIFYIIGTGLSINDITEEEWEFLRDKNTLAFGSFPLCGYPTKYFMTYEKPNILIDDAYHYIDIWDKSVLIDALATYGNFNTTLLLFYMGDVTLASKFRFPVIPINKSTALFLPSKSPWFVDQPKPPHRFKECRAHNFRQPLFRFRGSLSAVINSALILGATEINLIGIDLNCQHDFYFDSNKWIKNEKIKDICRNILFPALHHRYINKQKAIPKLDMDKNHTTDIPYKDISRWGDRELRGMSDTIRWMDSEMKDEGICKMYITNKISKLYTDKILEYKPIIELHE